ncbi:MAG: hypothetical protein ACI311_06370 [Bacilli bacterium]
MRKAYIVLLSLFLVSCRTNNEVKISEPSQYEYSDITIYLIDKEEIFSFANETYYIYFYKENCSHCNSIKQTVIKKALERNDIYFYDDTNESIKIKDITNSLLGISKSEDIFIYGTPMLISITQAKISSYYLGTEQIEKFLSLL